MTQPFVHVVLTRFNVRVGYTKSQSVNDPEWLRQRFGLFENFCFRSMREQRVRFKWIVFFDSDTPHEFLGRIERYSSFSAFTPLFVQGALTDARIATLLKEIVRLDKGYLITTRLDNDDAVAVDFLRRIQRSFRKRELELLNCPLGYQLKDGKLYLSADMSNPFLSLVERVTNRDRENCPKTVFCGAHHLLSSVAPIRQISARPMWVQVLHGGNIANQLRGVRRIQLQLPSRFVFGADVRFENDSGWSRCKDLFLSTRSLLAKYISTR